MVLFPHGLVHGDGNGGQGFPIPAGKGIYNGLVGQHRIQQELAGNAVAVHSIDERLVLEVGDGNYLLCGELVDGEPILDEEDGKLKQ